MLKKKILTYPEMEEFPVHYASSSVTFDVKKLHFELNERLIKTYDKCEWIKKLMFVGC